MTTIPASAQTNLASYLFTGGSASATNVTENITASNAVWTGLSGTQFGFSTVKNDAYARFDSVGTTTLNANRYLEFTLSAAPGYFLDLSAIDFIIGYSASGAQTRTNFASVRSSVDSFASDLSMTPGPTTTASIGTNAAVTIYSSPYTVDLSSPTYFGLTNFTFRIYPFVSNAAANNSFSRFNDVNFLGSVSIASYVWTGGSGAWSLAGNWSDSRLGADNGLMVFAGSGGASTNNSVSTIRGLVFSNTAESYTVSGNALTLGLSSAGITNNSGNVQTVLNNLTLSTNAVVSSASGAVVLGGTIALGTNNLAFDAIGAITNTGAISGTGGLSKTGAGTLVLSGDNIYSGDTALEGGVIRAAHGNALGTGSLIASTGTTFELTNGITVTNDLSVYIVKFADGGNTLSGTITNNNTVYDVAAGTTNTLSGLVTGSGGLELIGGGVLAVTGTTNNYTGNTTISNGTLRITTLADSNSVSSIGTSNNITLAGANATNVILDYTGGNVATDRTLVLTNGGGTINMASSATEMTLTGSASGAGTLVVGEGTLILSNTGTSNSFAPAAIQLNSGATLELADNNQIGDSTGLILNGGTFRVGTATTGFSDTLGTLTLNASSTIDLGAWSTGLRQLTFADSSAITWTGTLIITNWQGVVTPGGSSSDVAEILFGTAGLTSTQLAQVYWANQDVNGAALIGGNGELAPIPEARVVWGAAALTAFVVWRERRRCLSLLGQVFGRGRIRR